MAKLSLLIMLGVMQVSILTIIKGDCPEPIFQSPSPSCLGETAVYSCKSYDLPGYYRTIWDVNEPSAPSGCPLLHYLWPNTSYSCGSFLAYSAGKSNDSCFFSELRVTASEVLNGTTISCFFASPQHPPHKRGSGILQLTGPIWTEVSGVKLFNWSHNASNTSRYLTVTIRWSISHALNITSYIVRVIPPASSCAEVCTITTDNVKFEKREIDLELALGVEYNITVTTINCETQKGRESDPYHILLDYPRPPLACDVVPLYHDSSLSHIEVSWEQSLSDECELEVDSYTISIEPPITSPISIASNTSCMAGKCHHYIDLSSMVVNTIITVALTASNGIGESQPTYCNHLNITSPTKAHTSSSLTIIVFALVGTLVSIISCLSGALIHRVLTHSSCMNKKTSTDNQPDDVEQSLSAPPPPPPIYDEITDHCSGVTETRTTTVENTDQEGILTFNNEAYATV